jgi:uncharacterized protein (TIGR02246 family)
VARELTNPEGTNNETAIREIFDSWAAAVRAEDFNAIRANHSPDMLMFDVPPPLFSRGLDAYMDTWTLFYKSQAKPVVFNFNFDGNDNDIEITAGQDVAFVTAIGRCVYIPPGGGATNLQFRLTMGLRKQDGKWWIVHEHHSVPAEE